MSQRYSSFSLNNKSNKKMIPDWAYTTGVLETPRGKFIARVRDKGTCRTISQHDKREDAQEAHDKFYENLQNK